MSDAPPTPDASATDAPPEPDAPLGESGQKALEAMKVELKAARAEAKRAKTLEADLGKMREANQSEAEKALNQARTEGEQKARDEIGLDLNRAKVELAVMRAAGARFADPGDALRFLDPSELVDDSGRVNEKALTAEVDRLLEAKPYLASAATTTPRVPTGVRNGGRTDAAEDFNTLIRRSAGR